MKENPPIQKMEVEIRPPSSQERDEYSGMKLMPVEAHTILVNHGESLSETDKARLKEIVEGEYHSDQLITWEYDSKNLTLDGGYHDDDDDYRFM